MDKNIDNDNELLYTISEVAVLLKVNRNYVYSLINKGYLRSIKLGCRKITRKSLLQFLEKYDGSDLDELSVTNDVNDTPQNWVCGQKNLVGKRWANHNFAT